MPLPFIVNSTAAHVSVDGVSVSFGDRRVLTDVSFTISGAERLGLIGENGSGKSTLLRVIAGLLESDAGTVQTTVPGGHAVRFGLLHQEPPFAPTATVAEALNDAVAPALAAAAALDHAADAMAAAPTDEIASQIYANALEEAERLRVWDIDARIEEMLAGLGLAGLPRERRTAQLSGGQRARLALAWLLLSHPDVLLLDEPTNHLDDTATEHLRASLAAWNDPVLIASHDRAFLDEAVTGLIDLDPAPIPQIVGEQLCDDGPGSGIGVTRFTGTYTDFRQYQAKARARWINQFQAEQAELKRLSASLHEGHTVGHQGREPRTEGGAAKKFYADRNAKVVSRRVNDTRSKLEDLRARQVRKPPKDLTFNGLAAAVTARKTASANPSAILVATNVVVEGRLPATSITVGARQKWLITGLNGSGKSTLLQVLAGILEPDSGSITRASWARTGLLTQEITLPDPNHHGPSRTVRQAYSEIVGPELAERVPLNSFDLFAGRDENRQVGVLSIGQQRRLGLAAILADPPEILLLDEPTNHLSLSLVTELEAMIPDYPGAVLIASHDRWLRQRWTGERLELSEG